MKAWMPVVCAALGLFALQASASAWEPAPGHVQVPLWPGAAPDPLPVARPETTFTERSLVYYVALKNAGVPVEMHLYPTGGHAFGLRTAAAPITRWPRLVEAWLESIGMVGK